MYDNLAATLPLCWMNELLPHHGHDINVKMLCAENPATTTAELGHCLRHLDSLILHSDALIASKVGRAVKSLRKHPDASVGELELILRCSGGNACLRMPSVKHDDTKSLLSCRYPCVEIDRKVASDHCGRGIKSLRKRMRGLRRAIIVL